MNSTRGNPSAESNAASQVLPSPVASTTNPASKPSARVSTSRANASLWIELGAGTSSGSSASPVDTVSDAVAGASSGVPAEATSPGAPAVGDSLRCTRGSRRFS
jgi:hypothetical protein